MEQTKRIAKNTGFLYARMAITVFISLYVTRLVLAALGTEDFGTFSLVGGVIAMLTFLGAAMTSASQRFMSYAQGEGKQNKQKSIFNVSVLLHFFIGIAVVFVLEAAGYFFFNGILNIAPERMHAAQLIYQFLIVSTFFTIISVPYDAVINAHENMLFVAILGIVEAFLKLGIAFYITYTSFDKLISYGLLMAALAIILLLVRRIYCHNKYEEVEINIKKHYDKTIFKEMTSFAGWSLLGSSSSMIANYGQGIVINMFFGTAVNAAQGVALQVNGQLSAFANTMMKALNPVLAKSEGAGNRVLMIKASMMGSKVSFFLLLFFYTPIIIEMPYVFGIWLKEVPQYAVVFTTLLLLKSLIEQLFLTLGASIGAVGKIKQYQITESIIHAIPLIVTYMFFLKGYPASTLYLVFIVYAVIKGINRVYFAKKLFKLSIPLFVNDVILRCFFSFILLVSFSAIPLYFMDEGFERLLVIVLINTIMYFIIVYFVGFNKNERKQVTKLMPNIIKNKF